MTSRYEMLNKCFRFPGMLNFYISRNQITNSLELSISQLENENNETIKYISIDSKDHWRLNELDKISFFMSRGLVARLDSLNVEMLYERIKLIKSMKL